MTPKEIIEAVLARVLAAYDAARPADPGRSFFDLTDLSDAEEAIRLDQIDAMPESERDARRAVYRSAMEASYGSLFTSGDVWAVAQALDEMPVEGVTDGIKLVLNTLKRSGCERLITFFNWKLIEQPGYCNATRKLQARRKSR